MSIWNPKVADKAADRALKKDLVFAAAAFARRRHDLVGGDLAARLLSRGWIEWHAAQLRLTREGAAVCDRYLAAHW